MRGNFRKRSATHVERARIVSSSAGSAIHNPLASFMEDVPEQRFARAEWGRKSGCFLHKSTSPLPHSHASFSPNAVEGLQETSKTCAVGQYLKATPIFQSRI